MTAKSHHMTIVSEARRLASAYVRAAEIDGKPVAIEDAYVSAYLQGREDTLSEVRASLRFLPEGAIPRD